MAGDTINISLAEVTNTASTIKTLNQSLTSNLEEIKGSMNNLAGSWESEGSEAIRSKFNALQPRFDNYREIVESYAQFLDRTVEAYNTTETTITSNANAFK